MPKLLAPLLYFLENISSKPKVGGLQITDSSLQYVLLKKKELVTYASRLPPGVIVTGKLHDADQFLKILQDLHRLISSKNPNQVIKVVVSLPSSVVYTQSFNVPNISEEKVEEASRLNLQILSPIPSPEADMSYQIIGETPDRFELLGAFAEKKLIEQFRTLFIRANFQPILFEFPSLALGRLIGSNIPAATASILVLYISSDGLNIFILRNGELHFDYFRSWQSIQGENKEISKSLFETTIIDEIQRVINFILNRFKEMPKQVFLITPGLEADLKQTIEKNFGLQVSPFVPRDYNLSPVWFTALGSAQRGKWDLSGDRFIALGITSSLQVFYEERYLNFLKLWRNVLSGLLGFFLVVFIISASILVKQSKLLESRLKTFVGRLPQEEIANLEKSSNEFNNLVAAVKSVRARSQPWHLFFGKLQSLAESNNVTLDRFEINSINEPMTIAARAPDHNAVIRFKNILVKEPNFSNVDLPLSQIAVTADGSVAFNISFQFTPTP